MSLATAISKAITTSLLAKLPAEAAEKFDLDEEEFKDFLKEFLTSQLGKSAKGGRSGPKGINGKGRISGYILFSNDNRAGLKEENPDLKFTEIGKELGQMWGELTDEEKAEWNQTAADANEANGLPPAGTKAVAKGKGKAAPAKAKGKIAPAKGKAKVAPVKVKGKAAPVKGKAVTTMKIKRNQASKAWVVEGTNFVVQSLKDKTITGKLRGGKTISLSVAERKSCKDKGWKVKELEVKKTAPKKVVPKKPVKKVAPEPEEDEDGDAEGEDEEAEGDEDSE